MPTKAFPVRIPDPDIEAARAIAREEGLTLSAVIRRAVRRDVHRAVRT
jgi:hypothetical protein